MPRRNQSRSKSKKQNRKAPNRPKVRGVPQNDIAEARVLGAGGEPVDTPVGVSGDTDPNDMMLPVPSRRQETGTRQARGKRR